MDSVTSPKKKTIEGERIGALLGLQHFEGRKVCWSSRMGLGKLTKKSLTHTNQNQIIG